MFSIPFLPSYFGEQLSQRYRQSQIKAAVKVNQEVIRFYWSLGKDIVERQAENQYGKSFYANLSRDLKKAIPGVSGLTENNIRYAKRFYELYSQSQATLQQFAEKSDTSILQQAAESLTVDQLDAICSVPWGHHFLIIDKVKGDTSKALFYVAIEVKTDDFDFPDMGQIGGYVVAVNHQLKRPEDNPTIGLLICKKKNITLAQYALESSNQPMRVKGTGPETLPVEDEETMMTIMAHGIMMRTTIINGKTNNLK